MADQLCPLSQRRRADSAATTAPTRPRRKLARALQSRDATPKRDDVGESPSLAGGYSPPSASRASDGRIVRGAARKSLTKTGVFVDYRVRCVWVRPSNCSARCRSSIWPPPRNWPTNRTRASSISCTAGAGPGSWCRSAAACTRSPLAPMRYEGSVKHKEPWQPGRRGTLCPASVDRRAAQRLLDASAPVDDARYAVHEGRAYCARRDLNRARTTDSTERRAP